MKCKIPEISWHNRDPVLSVDIQPKTDKSTIYRVASGGTDSHVLIWNLSLTECGSEIIIDVAADLTRHQRAVNTVKWSPSGVFLASGDDESFIIIWKQKSESEPINILDNYSEQDKEMWITFKILRGHIEDVYDLSWSPNSNFLVSGSVDNTAIIWDVNKGKSISILNDHKGFVQGVAWDPKNQFIATLSTDRHLRIFDIQTKKVLHRISKSSLPVPEGHELYEKRIRLYHDDTLQTFFRRLCFTPDGKLLITPTGVTDYEGVIHPLNATYVFSRYSLKQPAIVLPCPDQYTIAVKCCPVLFKLRPYNAETNSPVIPLPYRMIFAIATKSSVYLYDTQQKVPFGLISNIHYTRLTDITWSNDGRIIIVSSTDGFCSIITFEEGELGEEFYGTSVISLNLIEDNILKEKKSKSKNKETEKTTEKITGSRASEIEMKFVEVDHSFSEKENETNISGENKSLELETESNENNNSKAMKITSEHTDVKGLFPDGVSGESSAKKNDFLTSSERNSHVDESFGNSEFQKASLLKDQNFVSLSNATSLATVLENLPKTSKLLLRESSEIIIDKKIISSDEKFKSPEKSNCAATPIMVRRHPRTPSNDMQTKNEMKLTPEQHEKFSSSPRVSEGKSKNINIAKEPKPIAVRKKPRALIITPVDKTSIVEEAMDAWPIGNNPITSETKNNDEKLETNKIAENNIPDSEPNAITASSDVITDRTEDIRLVYEDTASSSNPPHIGKNMTE